MASASHCLSLLFKGRRGSYPRRVPLRGYRSSSWDRWLITCIQPLTCRPRYRSTKIYLNVFKDSRQFLVTSTRFWRYRLGVNLAMLALTCFCNNDVWISLQKFTLKLDPYLISVSSKSEQASNYVSSLAASDNSKLDVERTCILTSPQTQHSIDSLADNKYGCYFTATFQS